MEMEKITIPYTEATKHIYETFSRLREEILMTPTPQQWEQLKEMYGEAYTMPRPVVKEEHYASR